MKNVKVSEILRVLKQEGWYIARNRGSHRQMKHPTKKGTVTVDGKPSDMICGLRLRGIEAQSGVVF